MRYDAPPAPAKPEIDRLLQRAVALHQRGSLPEAAELYQQVLGLSGDHPDALHLLGLLAHQAGAPDTAIALIGRAIALDGGAPEFHLNLGNALHAMGRSAEAAESFRRATRIRPDFAQAHFNLGNALLALREGPAAAAAYRDALRTAPDLAEAHLNLGALLADCGDLPAAGGHLRRAVELLPDCAQAHLHLGFVLRGLDDWRSAETHLRAALELDPNLADGHLLLGDVLVDLERYPDAEASYRAAIVLLPNSAEAHSNLGRLLEFTGRLDESETEHRRALAIQPEHAGAHWSYAPALLKQGRLPEGWAEFAWRWRAAEFHAARYLFSQPEWRGEPPAGRHMLVWGEQGVGDEIMFASCLPELIATGARVTLACAGRLGSLFARSFPEAAIVDAGVLEGPAMPRADYHIAIGDLPRHFRSTVASFPDRPGYLVPDPARAAFWRDRLATLGPGLRVGLSWRSQLVTAEREKSYTTLPQWAPILRTPGVQLINLQYDDCALALADARDRLGISIRSWPDLDLKNDFEGTAALMAGLDLVVSIPNSVGELAGALGRPTWRLHRGPGSWTMLGTDRRPWFPLMRIFEGDGSRDFGIVIAAVAAALADVSRHGREARAS